MLKVLATLPQLLNSSCSAIEESAGRAETSWQQKSLQEEAETTLQ
jgi:hypothetical protein